MTVTTSQNMYQGHLMVFDWMKECFETWAYGKGWLWTPLSMNRTSHALPFYALRAATPETALQLFWG
jgi:hypothetical protein